MACYTGKPNQRSQLVLPDQHQPIDLKHLHDDMGHMRTKRVSDFIVLSLLHRLNTYQQLITNSVY